MTFEALRTACTDAMARKPRGYCAPGTLLDLVDDVLDRARINADDSMSEGHSPSDWDRIALESVACALSERDTPAKVAAWFAGRGVRA